jgi:chromosomal replication initiation ATPase DnaA
LRRTFGDRPRNGGRLYGKKKEERDLWVFLLKQTGSYTNGEIGEMFGITYTAVSHIVKEVKNRMKTDQALQRDYALLKSQLKM